MIKTIRIYGRTVETTDGREYVAFSYTKNGEEFFQIKFNKTCDMIPQSAGYWLVTFDTKDVNKQASKEVNGFKPNDILWIAKIAEVKKDVAYEEQMRAKKQAEIDEMFD